MHITIKTDNNGSARFTRLVTAHRGEELEWMAGLWPKLGNSKVTQGAQVYEPLNEYLMTIPDEDKANLFALYKKAHEKLAMADDIDADKKVLTNIVTKMFNLIDYNHLTEWTLTYGNIAYNQDIHETYTGEYPLRQTYLKEDYNALVVMSMLFKLLTPIWGSFLHAFPTLDSGYKEITAFRLMRKSMVHKLPAMIRFKDYCEALVEKDKSNLTPSILTSMGTSEIPVYFVALAVVRRISTGEIRNPDKTIIKVAYKYLQSKSKNLSYGVRDKISGRPDTDEAESVAEKYRISQIVPDYAVVVTEEYIKNIPKIVRDINPKGNITKAQNYAKALKKTVAFDICEYHLPIVGLVCDRVMHSRTCRMLDREAYITLIAVAAAALSDIGYQSIANMILSPHVDTEGDIDLYAVGGFPFVTLTQENKERLDVLYPNQQYDSAGKPKGNPGVVMINHIVEDINRYGWDNRDVVPANIRNDIVDLLYIREEQLLAN